MCICSVESSCFLVSVIQAGGFKLFPIWKDRKMSVYATWLQHEQQSFPLCLETDTHFLCYIFISFTMRVFTCSSEHYRDCSPKNENFVITYSPSSSSKPVWMSLFCWTQRNIFCRMWETEQFWGTIDFHSIYFFLLWKFSYNSQNSLIINFLQNIVTEWQNFHFWVNYPFKSWPCVCERVWLCLYVSVEAPPVSDLLLIVSLGLL